MKCYLVPWYLSVILLIILKFSILEARQLYPPAKDFKRHRITQPTLYHGRTKRELSSSKDTNGEHHGQLTMKVNIDGEEYVLDLRLNDELVTDNHVVAFQKDGDTVIHRPSKEELDICQYSGNVRGKQNSWVAVSTCHGVRGVIYDGDHFRYIEPKGGKIQSEHYVYDHKDLNTNFNCGYKGGVTNNTEYDPVLLREHHEEKARKRSRASRYKRDTDETQIRGPYNSNKLSRYVELVLVVDNREYIANNQDRDLVHHQMKDVANIINAVYAPLNIFIALVGVVIWTERDEISLEENGDNTLNNFLHYRKTVLLSKIPNDNAHLLTRQKFHDGVVGKALKGPICTYEFSGGVATNHSMVLGLVATTIAHEMGHNFGMEHDTVEDCECPDEKCIMSPSSTSVVPIHWSSCSLKSLALSFEKGMDYCLKNKPAKLYESPTCGNGFIEPGEQCDCGLLLDPKVHSLCTQCCNNDTCMLRRNATCAAGECCDFETCRPKRGGTVCRSASRECDLPEFCTGHSEYCPADVYKMDAEPCGAKGDAYCVRGSCRTHRDQCQLLWGTTGENSDRQCYAMNIKGDESGNCGYDRMRKTYKQCNHEDVLCGLLQCKHLNERLEFGMESVATLAHRFINNNGSIIACRTAIIDLGLSDVDPGLVPDGAKCGFNKMCMKQRCVPVSQVRAEISQLETSVCPSNCTGHGVCNSKGHCHCEIGFGGALCNMPGPGGSIESGPATDPSVQRNFMVAMYIIFLGIIPSIVLIMFLLYYSRHNVLPCMKKPKKSLQSPKKSSLQRLSQGVSKFAANFHNNAPSSQPVNVHTLSSPDDMSSSLLRSDSDRSPTGNINSSINIFGNFNGFSLKPIEKNTPKEEPTVNNDKPKENITNKSAKITPVHRSSSNSQNLITQGVLKPVLRTAPPLPVVPNTGKSSPKSSPSVKRNNSTVQNRIKALMNAERTEELHPISANPPLRPVISSPILEASTCTAKELISPLQGSKTLKPVRAAPTLPPSDSKRPLSMCTEIPQKPLPDEPKKVKEGISLNRIASFLKQEKPKEKERNAVERSLSLPKSNHQVKVPLRNLEISNPILQKNIELSVTTVPVVSDTEDEDLKPINRTQSMRSPSSQKPVLQSFGSMRQAPAAPRPVSMVGRPSAPPPPLPNTLYQNTKPEIKSTDYVDCIEEKQAPLAHIDEESGDNIYAVIEESPIKSKPLPGVPSPIKTIPQAPPAGYNTPRPITSNSGSTESMGLLGEIVNEIQHRNFDSIYSTATLARKKKERERLEREKRESTSTNADSVYSNSGAKSNVSTTSSGYLHPSAVNVPTYMNKENLRNEENKAEPEKTPPSPKGPNSKIPTFARQVTPPGLKSTTSFKNVPSSPKNVTKNTPKIANSPDLVSSCSVADTKNVKPPDVVNNNKTTEAPKLSTKPTVTPKPSDNRPPLRPTPSEKKSSTVKTTPTLKPVNSATNIKSQTEKNPSVNRANSKVDSNVKSIADNLNKNKPKVVPKPSSSVANVNKNETLVNKPVATKLTPKNSNVASLQQKFENRKSFGKDTSIKK